MNDYPYVRAWCRMMASLPYYIEAQLQQARKDGAPATATYKSANGKWRTFNDIQSDSTRDRISSLVAQMRITK